MKRTLLPLLVLLLAAAIAAAPTDQAKKSTAPAGASPADRKAARTPASRPATTMAPAPVAAARSRPPARTRQVPGDHGSVQAALDAAAPFDTIEVAPGKYLESVVLGARQRGIVLRSLAGPAETILVSGGDTRLLTFDEVDTLVTVIGFTLQGGRPQFDGGGVYAYRSRLELRNCVLRNNQTPGDGGAVALYESEAILRDCRLEDNVARRGGGLFVGGSRVRLERTAISGNRAELEGGGVYCSDGSRLEPGANAIEGNRPDEMAGCTQPPALPPNPHR